MTATTVTSPLIEVAVITAEAVGLVTSTPIIDRAKDGREVLLRGPRMPTGNTPAEQRAHAELLPVIKLSARQLLTIAQGVPVDVGPGYTVRAGAARVRLATRIEVMVFNRQARDTLFEQLGTTDQDALPPPLDADKAAELVKPIDLSPEHLRELVSRFDPFHFG